MTPNPRAIRGAHSGLQLFELGADGPRRDGGGMASLATRQLLAPSDGARYRRLALDLDLKGDLVLTFHEMGGALEAAWGVDDREVSVRIAGEAVARLAHVLLSERLQGRPAALEELLALCEAHEIEPELACWT